MERNNQQTRHRYIELLAYWEGRINSRRLINRFGISRQQASSDINSYLALAPENLLYDGSSKAYLAADSFSCRFISSDVMDYLTEVQYLQNSEAGELAVPELPHISLHLPARKISPVIMRSLVTAIREKRRIEVDYVSLNSPNREGRIIAPHSFVNTGLRWHLRAWCEKSEQYRDFVLSRFRGTPDLLGKTTHTAEFDHGWNTQVTIVLQPDPRLTPAKREVLENDYQMQNGQLPITTKGCLVNYLLRELQINTKMLDGTPEAQQLVCVNLQDIKPWLFE